MLPKRRLAGYEINHPSDSILQFPFHLPTFNRNPDAYHTLYNLAGLSAAQHRVRMVPPEKEWVPQYGEP